MVMPSDLEIETYDADAFLFGYEKASVNFPFRIDMQQLKQILPIIKKQKKEIFIAFNKNFTNSEIKELRKTLLELEEMNIDGFLYYDVALVQLKAELQLKTPLVWGAEHLTTNYETMNFWNQFGADFCLVSGEITKKEILEIKQYAKPKLIVPIFGHLPMFFSKRHEVKNYLNYFNIPDQSALHYLEKEGREYPIIDDEEGTVVYSSHILNGYGEYLEMKQHKIDYVLLNSFLISKEDFREVLAIYHQENKDLELQIDAKFPNQTDKGFFYKETIYQVKKYETKE